MRSRIIQIVVLVAALVVTVVVLAQRGGQPSSAPADLARVTVVRGEVGPTVTLRGVVVGQARYNLYGESGRASDLVEGDRIVRTVGPPTGAGPETAVAEVEASGPLIRAAVAPEVMFQFADRPRRIRVQAIGGQGPVVCEPLGRPGAAVLPVSRPGGVVLCRPPAEAAFFNGQPVVVEVDFALRSNVLVLPVEVVAGSLKEGSVLLLRGEARVEHSVGLGASDGRMIEITSGLRAGDVVLADAPVLDGYYDLGR